MSQVKFLPGQLYCFREGVRNVDNRFWYLNSAGDCSIEEFIVESDSIVVYIRDYKNHQPLLEWGVYLVNDRLGVALKKYFKPVPRSK